ncbi:MAG: type IV secretion system DNA-binding domain-containing protein [Bryobacteraceae bacterium]|jgi:predicted DNA-binding transcriptional regulator AlpA
MPCESSSAVHALTRQFYDWEIRGRGWQVFDRPVALEPPFRPFVGHYLPGAQPGIDDGRMPTRLSSFFESLKPRADETAAALPAEEEEPEPEYVTEPDRIVEVATVLPSETKITYDAAGQFLMSLGHLARPVGFEVIGTRDTTLVQFACSPIDRRQVHEQLQAYFPEVCLAEREGYLGALWDNTGGKGTAIVEYGLSKEFMRPLRTFDRFDPDPLAGLIGAMAELGVGDTALFQMLFAPLRHPWAESILRAVTDEAGESFFADDPNMVKLAAEKVSSPLFAAVIRVAAQSSKAKRAWRIAENAGKALRQFAAPSSNELLPLSNDRYDERRHSADVVARTSCRAGLILNRNELISLVHLPSASARSVKLQREERKTKVAPALVLGHSLVLGENQHVGKTVRVSMSAEQRIRHMHVIGASGSGKSTLLLNMINQDIEHGEGLAVFDPHGDLIDEVLGRVPEKRIRDVVLLDPSDEAYPVGFNILSAHSDLERNLLASDLVSVFRRLSTTFGDQMTTVLGNAVVAFLESSEGGTLADLRRFLVEPGFRERFLPTVGDPEIVYYWQNEFPLLKDRPQGPILTRLNTFLRPKVIRYMVSQKEDRLDFAEIMNGRKILLAKLSQGLIGEENSYLLGTLLVSKLNQIATSRQNRAAAERTPFYLYIDEFHNFITPSLAAILSGARKYHLGLILAHQELHQLSTGDGDVASAVISNPYARVCFRLGDFDAKKLEEGFSYFGAKDLQNLGVGEAVVRMERAEYDFNLKTYPSPAVEPALAARRREQIVAASRERYARPREEVERLLQARRTTPQAQPGRERPKSTAPPAVPSPKEKATAEVETGARPLEVRTPGRGGEQHKYLQQLIKRWAEGRGYTVTLEKPMLDGLASVDLVLEKRGSTPVACEISVTTSPEHELRNAEKCLAAGFENVFLVAPDKDALTRVRARAASVLSANQIKKLRFFLPEQVFSAVAALEANIPEAPAGAEPAELLTAREVEELLRIDVKTIYGYVQKGLMPYVRIQSNLRFVKADVLSWVAEHRSNGKTARGK